MDKCDVVYAGGVTEVEEHIFSRHDPSLAEPGSEVDSQCGCVSRVLFNNK
jgi:hypothetical protein